MRHADPSLPVRLYDRAIRGLALLTRRIVRLTRSGAGTSLPGLLIQKLDPGFVKRRADRLEDGVVVVSGTNGKTTTAGMVATILRAAGVVVAHNESGANLFRGVATTLASTPPTARAAVLEVDEGALARLVPLLRPRVLILTNVFRDQLDRFGEPERVVELLGDAARGAPPGCAVIANADDPLLWHVVETVGATGFGVLAPCGGDHGAGTAGGEPEVCPRCGHELAYRRRTIAHLGAATCPSCGWGTPRPSVLAEISGPTTLGLLSLRIGGTRLDLAAGGVHNAYNAAAAVAAAAALGVPMRAVRRGLRGFAPGFGRAERFRVEGRPLWLLLMKNPAGGNVLVPQVVSEPSVGAVVIAVNDRWADGRDISWIWDADFEQLVRSGLPIVAGGERAADVAVRIKYAGGTPVVVEPDPARALTAACAPDGRSVVVLATYSAMLEFRRVLLGSRVRRLPERAA